MLIFLTLSTNLKLKILVSYSISTIKIILKTFFSSKLLTSLYFKLIKKGDIISIKKTLLKLF